MSINRRTLLAGLAASVTLPASAVLSALGAVRAAPLTLVARDTTASILSQPTPGIMSYGAGAPPVLRLKRGAAAEILFTNQMDEMTTVHWHGIRLPVAMDGVAWVSQIPLGTGESFTYAFTPPDAGTFWYHPHCNTFEQMQRGLNGILIVEEEEDPGFDSDLPLLLRDFRLKSDGSFMALSVPRNAARGGTLGPVMTVNWQVDPTLTAFGFTRLRLVNSDVTRVHRLHLPGTEGVVLARDGHPLDMPMDWPGTPETALDLAPGQRADLGLILAPGAEIELMTEGKGGPRRLARITGAPGPARALADLPRLAPNPLPALDLAAAETLNFVFGWSPAGNAKGGSALCGETGKRFWGINRIAAAADGPDPGAPLATLERGKTYILRLHNETQNDHPIHLHGMAFRVLRSDRRRLVPHWADTVHLYPDEKVEIALVADNPGKWVFHCHVIEHQKTGLSGYIEVL